LNESDPTIEQDLNTFLNYCKSGIYNGLTVTDAGTEPTSATGAAIVATATATGSTSGQKSAGAVNIAGMGFVGLVLAIGGALIEM
jgi:hypothetical protein